MDGNLDFKVQNGYVLLNNIKLKLGISKAAAHRYSKYLDIPIEKNEKNFEHIAVEFLPLFVTIRDELDRYHRDYYTAYEGSVILHMNQRRFLKAARDLNLLESYELIGQYFIKKSDLDKVKEFNEQYKFMNDEMITVKQVCSKLGIERRTARRLFLEYNVSITELDNYGWRFVPADTIQKLKPVVERSRDIEKNGVPIFDFANEVSMHKNTLVKLCKNADIPILKSDINGFRYISNADARVIKFLYSLHKDDILKERLVGESLASLYSTFCSYTGLKITSFRSDNPFSESDHTEGGNLEKRVSDVIPKDVFRMYMRDISLFTIPKRDEYFRLAKEIDDCKRKGVSDHNIVNEFVLRNQKLVIQVANRYSGNGIEIDDLVQEGNLGLMRAIRKFNPNRKTGFYSYAIWWVTQAMQAAISQKLKPISYPRYIPEVISKVKTATSHLKQKLGSEPSAHDIANYLDVDCEQIMFIRNLSRNPVYLDRPLEHSSEDLSNFMASYDVDFEKSERAIAVDEVLKSIPKNYSKSLRLRYGIDDGVDRTLEEVGNELGVSRQAVFELNKNAIRKIMHPNRIEVLRDFY